MPLADMSDCILQCRIPIDLIRRRSAPVTMGRVGETTEEVICPIASVQMSTGDDLLMLPEGMRTEEAITVYTIDKLYPGNAPDPNDPQQTIYPDRICYSGETYEVKNVENWKAQGNYYKSIAVKVGQ